GRFHAEPISEAGQLVSVCRYVERNALSAGLVDRAENWPWCSLAERLLPNPSVPLESAAYLSSPSWIEYVNSVLTTRDRVRQEQRLARKVSDTIGLRPQPPQNCGKVLRPPK